MSILVQRRERNLLDGRSGRRRCLLLLLLDDLAHRGTLGRTTPKCERHTKQGWRPCRTRGGRGYRFTGGRGTAVRVILVVNVQLAIFILAVDGDLPVCFVLDHGRRGFSDVVKSIVLDACSLGIIDALRGVEALRVGEYETDI
jgi:hypothetical protein